MSRLAPIGPDAEAARVWQPKTSSDGASRITLAQLRATTIAPRWPAVALAVGLSLALHLAAMAALAPRGEVAPAGHAPPAQAALGHAFADLALGATPVTPMAAPTAPVLPARSAPASPASTATPAPAALPALPDTTALAQPNAAKASSESAPRSRPDPAPARDDPPVTAAPVDADTPRPQPRPDPDARAPAQTAGNAPQPARRGAATGQERTHATQSGAATQTAPTASGSGAVAAYPGEILRRLQRVREARVGARGRAVVVFRVADGGRLAEVSIATGSGSAAVDAAALEHVRRAAPFPPPPAGAQRQFSFEFVSR